MNITFNEEKHQYFKDGILIPSVSELVDIVCGKVPYNQRDNVACDRGTNIHKIVELDIKQDLDETSVHDDYKGYLQAWHKFLEDNKQYDRDDMECEKIFYSDYGFAGKPDIITGNTIIDIKTGAKNKSRYQLQLHAYNLFFKPEDRKYMKLLYLNDDGTYECQAIKYANYLDRMIINSVHMWNYRNR